MNKKQTILAAAGGVSALLVVGAGVLTFTSWQAAGDAEKKMQSSKSSLARYYKEEVFPSQANVDVYRTNLLLAQAWVGDLSRGVRLDLLRRRQLQDLGPLRNRPLDLLALRRHVLDAPTIDAGDLRRAQAHRRARTVHRDIASTNHKDIFKLFIIFNSITIFNTA